MLFACNLEPGSIFTLKMLINTYCLEDESWSQIPKLDRKQLQSEWALWARDGLVLTKGQLEPYGTLISGESLYRIVEWHGEEDDE